MRYPYEETDGWYILDENGDQHGPFETEELAIAAVAPIPPPNKPRGPRLG